MSLTIQVLTEDADLQAYADFLEDTKERAENPREMIVPILLEAMQPMVASEKAFLGGHSKSGALVVSLEARTGSGDREGTISVFSAPTAKPAVLRATWGKRGRKQQQAWFANLSGRGRRAVFYGPIVHQGHRVIKRNAAGELYQAGVAEPIPFAQQA